MVKLDRTNKNPAEAGPTPSGASFCIPVACGELQSNWEKPAPARCKNAFNPIFCQWFWHIKEYPR